MAIELTKLGGQKKHFYCAFLGVYLTQEHFKTQHLFIHTHMFIHGWKRRLMHINTFTPAIAVRFRCVQRYRLAGQTLVALCSHAHTGKGATNATHAYAAYSKTQKKQAADVCV